MKRREERRYTGAPNIEQMIKIGNEMINQAIDSYWSNSPWRWSARLTNSSTRGRPGTGD